MPAGKPPKFYRISIYSSNCLPGGAWYDGQYFVDVPDFLDSDDYQIAVESLNINRSGANIGLGYGVNTGQLVQGNSYSTLTQSLSQALLLNNTNSFYRMLDFGSIGIPLRDMSFMRGQLLHIYFTTLDGVPITNMGAATALSYFGAGLLWSMTLIVYPIPKL
jgi:hypothetical protein